MRVLLAQLAPAKGDVAANLDRLAALVRAHPVDLAVFPELFLSGYRVGDQVHRIAMEPDGAVGQALRAASAAAHTAIVVGAPVRAPERSGEVYNAAVLVDPSGRLTYQVKRYLPTYGPFEEGSFFTPTDTSEVVTLGPHRIGLEICYDAFFPEITRSLALAGAELLVAISASPVTSRRLFERILPARAIENAAAVVYVNRVGVEDGVVFGGGSGAWDPRGEPLALENVAFDRREPEELAAVATIDLAEVPRWRRFRPTLRDVASRPPAPPIDAASVGSPSTEGATRTARL